MLLGDSNFWLDVCTDDMLIKLWDWDKKWTCTQVFEGHTHYVMQVVINPKDNNTFASASLDRTVKVDILCYYIIQYNNRSSVLNYEGYFLPDTAKLRR